MALRVARLSRRCARRGVDEAFRSIAGVRLIRHARLAARPVALDFRSRAAVVDRRTNGRGRTAIATNAASRCPAYSPRAATGRPRGLAAGDESQRQYTRKPNRIAHHKRLILVFVYHEIEIQRVAAAEAVKRLRAFKTQ